MVRWTDKEYGISYWGSKDKMISCFDDLFELQKDKEYMIDLFTGGFAVCDYALDKTNFKIISNDLNPYMIALYKELLNGSPNLINIEDNVITKEEFLLIQSNPENYDDWYVGYVLATSTYYGNHKDYNDNLDEVAFNKDKLNAVKKHIPNKDRIELYNMDYEECYNNIPKEVLEKSFIYCDAPYVDTIGYIFGSDFDNDKFWNWFRECPYPVYASAIIAPDDIQEVVFKTTGTRTDRRLVVDSELVYESIYWNGK